MRPRLALAGVAFAFGLGVALPTWSQDSPFRPGANPVSNQGWNAAVITTGTAYTLSRAIFMGGAAACNITFTMNGGASVQFQNVQPGEILPVQTTLVSATTCTAGTLIDIF
jgi:hypothetical protein